MASAGNWTSYWNAGDTSGSCLPDGSHAARTALSDCWQDFARQTLENARVIDLACGRGAAGEAVLRAHGAVDLIGVDQARIAPGTELPFPVKGDVDLAELPFGDAAFDGAISQFGFEYAGDAAAGELARVVKPGGRVRLVTHHAHSAVFRANGVRAAILRDLLSGKVETLAARRDTGALQSLFDPLVHAHGQHPLVMELASAFRDLLRLPDDERHKRAEALRAGMARELALLDEMAGAALDEAAVHRLFERTGPALEWDEASVLRAGEDILAWQLDARRKA